MCDEFVPALDAEIARLDLELRSDLRYVRLRELERVRGLYRPTNGATTPPEKATSVASATSAHRDEPMEPRRGGRQPTPEREKALTVAKMLVSNRRGPVPTREIYDHLTAEGIFIGGEKPLNNLSAMLSYSNLFASHGRSGWTLRERDDEFEPIDQNLYDSAAESVLADLEMDALRAIADSHQKEIPPELEAKLIAQVRADAARSLTPDEVAALRDAFWRNLTRAIG